MRRGRILLFFVAAFLVVTLVIGIAGGRDTNDSGSQRGARDASPGAGQGTGGPGSGGDDGRRTAGSGDGGGGSGEGSVGEGGAGTGADGGVGGNVPAAPAPCPTGRVELFDPGANADSSLLIAELSVRNHTNGPITINGAEVAVEDGDGNRYVVPVTGDNELAPDQVVRWDGSGAFWPESRGRPRVVSVETQATTARWSGDFAGRDDCGTPRLDVT